MKQVGYISRHNRTFEAYDCPDKSSMTEQNLRLSQAEKAIDMANGRIPIIPPAQITPITDQSEVLPEHLSDMLGVYHSPFIDPATKSRLFQRLRTSYSDYIAEREAKTKEEETIRLTQKEAEYNELIRKLKEDLVLPK